MKVKNIIFKLEIQGDGIVNMDSNDQKWIHNGFNSILRTNGNYNNVSFAKKNFYKDGDSLNFKIKISSDCLKKEIFSRDVIAQTPNIVHHDYLLYSYIASPVSLLRGYLFADRNFPFKRKGALTICDAEQTCNAVSYIETFSRSGEKNEKDVDLDKSDNTFYKKETVGKIKYQTQGSIDLMQLQFVSCDQVFDRYSFNPDKYSIWKQFLQKRIPSFNSELGYYKQNGSSIEIPEFGVHLSEQDVIFLIKEMLKRVFEMNITRKNAYAKTQSLKIKLVKDAISDTFSNQENWIEIKSLEDIDSLSFEVHDFYELINLEDAKKLRQQVEEQLKNDKQKAIKEKKSKKEKDASDE